MKKRGKKTAKKASISGKALQKQLSVIGLKIKKARITRGLSIFDLSNKCGVAVPQLYKIESGSNCTLKTILKVRNALRMKITI